MIYILRVKEVGTTTFKQDWRLQSTDPKLQESDKYVAKAGDLFSITSIDRNVANYGGNHWKVAFGRPLQPKQGTAKTSWFVYAPDVQELSATVIA
jgi:hypothetical protein